MQATTPPAIAGRSACAVPRRAASVRMASLETGAMK